MAALAIAVPSPVYAGTSPSVVYPDGLVVQVGQLEPMPSTDAATCTDGGICRSGSAPGTHLVRVDIHLSLAPGVPAVPLAVMAGTASGIGLAVGADRRPVAVDCGNMAETTILCTDIGASLPDRVGPGAPVELCESFDLPDGSVTPLTVTFTPPVRDGPLPTVTFTATA